MTQTESSTSTVRSRITGTVVPVRGNDIDTDRIIPARYLRTVTFDGLGEHAFEDDRAGGGHAFDDPRFGGASVLVANDNFGCGSSREHAPQALMRWGIEAFVAQSFAEIFFGNCVSLGLPCMVAEAADVEQLMAAVEADAAITVECDVETQLVRFGGQQIPASVPAGPRQQFLNGSWDALGQLLDDPSAIASAATRLPYINGF
ncbi:MAG TPA: 3-isopropylmalate dehydratase small subunit [Candidatus Latescibacteria bacterium]|jgi:3-isopropylmalate/(R)-2-methylmalate dehydratase small subunit|nr:isopropylmalate isomerase [Gemmatimonadaceae bacterium]MDP6019047.1 3-isopropylmalate dehydratase small subunit [Candidatus Latescibacterota bacterium]HJP34037.1 3-isopropylmalate dehydratase small subunit [Candidatus Latescibacterota bacterium]|tara:strand:- start:731 stop:1339 length:609 start_codon:yes stop_codon:yes gene_type:complete